MQHVRLNGDARRITPTRRLGESFMAPRPRRPCRRGLIAGTLFLLFVPTAAWADAGTALMWFGALHLFIGNAVIGVIEALVAAKVFRVSLKRGIPILILANYVSAWTVALGLCGWLPVATPPSSLRFVFVHGLSVLLLFILVSWVLSVGIEWPFCHWALPRERRNWRSSWLMSLLMQTASYALLVPYYLCVSPLTLYTRAHPTPTTAFTHNPEAQVYFIGAADGHVWRIRLDGSQRRLVSRIRIRNQDARLFVRRGGPSHQAPLCVQGHPRDGSSRVILQRFPARSSQWPRTQEFDRVDGTWFNFGEAADLRPKDHRRWHVRTGFWAAEGLAASCDREEYRLSLETPLVAWQWRNATILPGEEVVAQLGDMIVLLDLESRRVGFLVSGRGPVVTLPDR